MKPDILEDLNVEESGLQDGSGGDSAGSSIASVSQHSNDLDINVLNSRDGSISVTQDALSVVSDTTENGNSTLISENNDSQTQNGLHVVWGIKDEFLRGNGNEIDLQADAGECAMRILFKDFMLIVTKKMEEVMSDPDRPLSKILTRGEDAQFDQILMAFGSVSEYCLPSLLRTLFAWYDLQLNSDDSNNGTAEPKKTDLKGKSGEASDSKDTDWLQERRDLAVEFIFCLVLTEVLLSLEFHPGHDKLITHLEDIAFKHFKYREGTQSGPNACNVHALADLYAEVVGLIAQWRFPNIRNRFSSELKELRSKELNPHTTQSIISLLMGMKFLRVKMVPINLLEMSFAFLQECAQYFLEVKDKDIKHALAGLFVEILIPVAASVKNEVNVPCLKNFVDSLYTQTMDMCAKSKHRLAIFPLVTCLLCVSQKSFFLQNWHYFLAMCLSNLKNRDPKMSRVALESLYRLIWVYMIRIKCESNSATSSRLQSIVNSLFPKGSKAVVPRDTPLNIFVKIIQFIAQERLDFAMKEIVFDLLSVGRPIKVILTPERMNIGLRAFLVVSDSLQQKEGDPPMPRTSGVLPSGNTLRVKKTFLNKLLTEDAAKGIGMSPYFLHVKRVFVDILRALDIHYGRPLMMTSTQNVNKEPDEMLTGERKPRIDLFRTCVAAIPRLIPENMTRTELVDLLSRLTMHMDEELRGLSFQSLQTLMVDFPDWRHDVIHGFIQFLSRDLHDTFPNLFDNGLRMGLQLLTTWKNAVSPSLTSKSSTRKIDKIQQNSTEVDIITNVLHYVEAFCLVILCSSRVCPRRLAIHILREVKFLLKSIGKQEDDKPLIDVLDKNCFCVLEQSLSVLPTNDKGALLISSNIDLQWIADRAFTWTPSVLEEGNPKTSLLNLRSCSSTLDIWTLCMFGFLQKDILFSQCPSAISQTWPIVYNRLHTLFSVIDPTPVSDNRASLLRSSAPPRKPTSERDQYMVLWRCYVIFATRVVPTVPNPVIRCASPDLSLSLQGTLNLHNFLKHAWEEFENESHSLNCMSVSEPKTWRFRASSSPDNMQIAERSSDSKSVNVSPSGLYKLLVPLLRCEVADVKDAAVFALSSINADALKDLMEELAPYIREAIDRKQENMRRRRRRDTLRLNLVKTFEFIAEHGTFGTSPCVLDRDTHTLNPTIVEYIDGARLCLETEADKDSIPDIKLHFCNFIRNVIRSFPIDVYPTLLTRDLRSKLFTLFANWSGPFCSSLNTVSPAVTTTAVSNTSECLNLNEEELQFAALQALSAVLCCGPCFDASILAEEGPLYSWLDALLASKVEKVYHLAYTAVILLLECNTEVGALLDWVVDRCYTAKPQIADGCFLALAAIFSAREYPCDHYTAIINVTLMNTGCPRINVRESALQLLQILDKRFFGSVSLLPPECESTGGTVEDSRRTTDTIDLLMSTTYCCSQIQLSHQLAQLHPELTMPMFSEITYRFQTARPEVRQLLLQYLLPWLHNMELVDPNIAAICCLPNDQFPSTNDLRRSDSRREGWGSAEATEMVLNNLFYITVKFSDEHAKEIEEVWATLCTCWLNNLKIIIRYLVIISGMAPNELLTYTKRVTVYLAKASTDKLLDEMLVELQTVETLNCLIERTETPPFYRLTSIRKVSNYSDPDPHADQDGSGSEMSVEKGTIHTKRHSGEESGANTSGSKPDSTPRTVAGSRYTTPKNSKLISHVLEENVTLQIENEMPSIIMTVNEEDCSPTRLRGDNFDIIQPHPLPMPEYGGYFAPLRDYLPETVQPSSGFHRCNVAVMLLTDVVTDTSEVDWSAHLPLILHMLFLGLDQGRNLIYQHCKQLLLNLLVVVADHSDHLSVAQTLLNRKTAQLEIGLPPVQPIPHNFTEPDSAFDNYLRIPISSVSQSTSMIMLPSPTETIISPTSPNVNDFLASFTDGEPPFSPVTRNTSIQNVIKSLVDFIASRKDQVLWNYEDITAKVWSVKSAEQLDIFLQHVLRIFQESMPDVLISERWAQIALQLGLSCSSRHIAGRSLQVFRFLRVPVNSRMLSDILSRLVETIAEQGEDMQGYVTELLLTLESAVDSLDSDFRSLDYMKEIFKSTPNLNKDLNVTAVKRSVGGVCLHAAGYHANPTAHTRSTSYSASYHNCVTKTAGSPPNLHLVKDTRKESDVEVKHGSSNLNKSRSAQSLKLLSDTASQDDKMTILAQLFWLGVSLLESDYEHEYLLALRVLSRVIRRMPLDRPDTSDKVEKIFNQLKWTSFQGVHSLLLKGCTNPSIYEPVVPVLSEFILYLDVPVIDPTQGLAFPLTVAAVLPYLILYYEDANEHCISSAECIAQASSGKISKLDNLATIMTLYSRRTFNKESLQWTKCVMKYLHESFPKYTSNMLSLLVEILEKGPSNIQLPVLSVIYCLFHYLDLSPTTSHSFSIEMLIPILKHVEGPHYKECIKILNIIVTRSAILLKNPSFYQYPFLESHMGSALNPKLTGIEVKIKKELPGRTMDFSFDSSQMLIIPKYKSSTKTDIDKSDDTKTTNDQSTQSAANGVSTLQSNTEHPVCSPRRSSSLSPADNAAVGWKRPWLCQSRVRECLVSLLTTCGQRVGLPKSPSVIFSQSSDLLEKQSSMASSTEEVSGPDLSDSRRDNNDHFGVFKDFDFLEYESESVEGESTDNFNWGVRRRLPGAGDGEGEADVAISSQAQDSISEKSPLLTIKKLDNENEPNNSVLIDDSSDEELGSESPLDEIIPNNMTGSRSSSSLRLLNNEDGRDTPTHSDISDSSVADIGDLTPCNTSPLLPVLHSFRPIHRDNNEEMWRVQICSLMDQVPLSSLHLYHIVYRLIKDVVHKAISLTQIANSLLTQYESGNETLQNHLSTISNILTDCCTQPPFVWFNASYVPLTEFLHFDALQLREHLDTLLDRKEHVNECIETLRAILKLQQLSDEQPNNDNINAEEAICDLGRGLYKFHFQLLLLLDSAEKMYQTLKYNAKRVKLQDVSDEVTLLKKTLIQIRKECQDYGESDSQELHESISFPCHSNNPVLQYLHDGKYLDALKCIKKTRVIWPNDLICSPSDENEVINVVSIYCSNLLETRPESFVIINEEKLSDIHNKLMDELLQILNTVNEMELHVKERRKHYRDH